MPSMFEIYERHAAEYAGLVDAEDYQGNLARCLGQVTDWSDKRVLEAGVGTGRVTRIYAESVASIVCLDRSAHMMEFAARRLSAYEEKLSFRVAENMRLPRISPKFDLFIEGWSWGHSIVDPSRSVESTAEALLSGACRNLRKGATVVLIETMGSNSAQPVAPHPRLARFYELLVGRYSFRQVVVRTDYRFPTADEAIRIMGFFFGDAMRKDLAAARPTVVREWTGVWYATAGSGCSAVAAR